MDGLHPENTSMILPPMASAGVLFISDQIMHVCRKGKGETTKFISGDELRKAVSQLAVDSGWMPANVRRYGITGGDPWFIAFHDAKIRRAYVGTRKIQIPCPPLVFVGWGKTYYLFTAKEKEFKKGMDLFVANYPNIHPRNNICWGGNTVMEALPANEESMWRLFWEAPFTNDLQGTESLIRLAKKGWKEFPLEKLKQKVGTVDDLAEQLKGEKLERDDPA
jgi:hypothetical protein